MNRNRKWTVIVASTLAWIALGNAGLHMDVGVVYGIAVLLVIVLAAAIPNRSS